MRCFIYSVGEVPRDFGAGKGFCDPGDAEGIRGTAGETDRGSTGAFRSLAAAEG